MNCPEPFRTYFRGTDLRAQVVEGDVTRFVYTGVHLQVVEYHFPANKVFPAHSHEAHEQMGLLVAGRMGFCVGGVERILAPGDFYHAPIGVEHNAWTLDEPAILVDFFGPPRDDLRGGV